jgi:serine-type D-Ala-D-Ala carboxypeptidase/endopeptidase (penicillin-binding protein 4)
MKKQMYVVALSLTLLLGGCAASGRGSGKNYVQQTALKYLHNIYLSGSSWSIMAVDLDAGRVLMHIDQDRCLTPASGMKLLTSACALETLGRDYRVSTPVFASRVLDSGGVLHGDLIVWGSGDPSISTRYMDTYANRLGAPYADTFISWADSLTAHGIQRIEGDLVGYTGLFGGDRWGSGWEWNELQYWYAAEISPLPYSDNCIEIKVTPGDSIDYPATFTWAPEIEGIEVTANIKTVKPTEAGIIFLDRDLQTNHIRLWGSIPQKGDIRIVRAAVYDADNFFMLALKKTLSDKGIVVTGKIRVTDQPPDTTAGQKVFVHQSPPLSAILRVMNRDSNNLHAEIVLRLMGAELIKRQDQMVKPEDSPFTVGKNRVEQWEGKLVGPAPGYVQADGSGMSRRNLISASGLVRVLSYMHRSPEQATFLGSLAYPGVGTLRGRFSVLPKEIHLLAKTGTMTRVRSVSGYLMLSDSPKIAFSIICNNYLCDTQEVDQTIENLVQLLSLHLRAPK